jgi:lysophospholipase
VSLPAPLYAIEGSPVPQGGAAEWLTAPDGVRVRAALFKPRCRLERARGSVVLSPGRTEPIEKFFEVIEELQARDFAVVVHDWRGQGLSDRALTDSVKGHAKGWRPFLADYAMVLASLGPRAPRPWIAMGNSMGGALTLLALTEGEDRFAGAILTAPMIRILTPGYPQALVRLVSVLHDWVGLGGSYTWDKRRPIFRSPFGSNVLTHDRVRWDRLQALFETVPEMILGNPTWGWVAAAMAAMARLSRPGAIEQLALPLWIVTAGEDHICDSRAGARLAARAPRGHHVEAPGAYHEILQETDARRQVFWRAFDALADEVAPR